MVMRCIHLASDEQNKTPMADGTESRPTTTWAMQIVLALRRAIHGRCKNVTLPWKTKPATSTEALGYMSSHSNPSLRETQTLLLEVGCFPLLHTGIQHAGQQKARKKTSLHNTAHIHTRSSAQPRLTALPASSSSSSAQPPPPLPPPDNAFASATPPAHPMPFPARFSDRRPAGAVLLASAPLRPRVPPPVRPFARAVAPASPTWFPCSSRLSRDIEPACRRDARAEAPSADMSL